MVLVSFIIDKNNDLWFQACSTIKLWTHFDRFDFSFRKIFIYFFPLIWCVISCKFVAANEFMIVDPCDYYFTNSVHIKCMHKRLAVVVFLSRDHVHRNTENM